jgi:transcriptional regulator with XRE-family HTH domain
MKEITRVSIESPAAIGERIKALRCAFGYKLGATLSATGIAQNALNNYERGRNRIKIDESAKIIRVTGVSLDWISLGLEHTLPPHVQEKFHAFRSGEDIPEHGTEARAPSQTSIDEPRHDDTVRDP